jgi:pre-mRNA-splicing factor CWC22
VIEKLFKVRKEKFKDHPGVVKELDLVEEDDRITHEISLDDEDLGSKANVMDHLNVFQFDPEYSKTEAEWEEIKIEILGETQLQGDYVESEEEVQEEDEPDKNVS